jgi:hypothetical protein
LRVNRINSADRRALRVNLCNSHGGRCAYCDDYVGMQGTIDHYLPEALGGTNERTNLRWACNGCNGLKAATPPEQWEQVKPPPVPRRGRLQTKIELLQMIARRAQTKSRQGTDQQPTRRYP